MNKFKLKAQNKMFVCIRDAKLCARATYDLADEFTEEKLSDGKSRFKSRDYYVTLEGENLILSKEDSVNNRLTISSENEDKINIKASNGKFLSREKDGQPILTANRNVAGPWEEWERWYSKSDHLKKYNEVLATDEQFLEIFRDLQSEVPGNIDEDKLIGEVKSFIKSDTIHYFNPFEFESRVAETQSDEKNCPLAITIVVIDVFLLAFSFLGVKTFVSNTAKKGLAESLKGQIANDIPKYKVLVDSLSKSFKDTSSGIKKGKTIAKGLFEILKFGAGTGIPKAVFKQFASGMKWYEWLLSGVSTLGQVTAMVATGGAAFIAEVAGIMVSLSWLGLDVAESVKECKD